ncbi:glutamate receptor ionotropic, delta-2-like [Parasteatoda tepidariorum]|uniref:glutamate receptor ionotropic, delta-2-like n=1 Tax=Parasteatoda tepidariorum TaxID=114398 RepID=UPI00077FAC57|nr:glutamate receptor ionotropic, delta-2-like [Parasteatoda tepidariorum]
MIPNKLRVAVLTIRHIVEVNTSDTRRLTFTGGVQANLIHALSVALGFAYEIVIPDDREWGRLDENNHWTGIVGMVFRNEADLAIGHLTMTPKRMRAVDFLPFTIEENTFVTRLPRERTKAGSYLQPFTLGVWIASTVTTFIMPFLFGYLMKKNVRLLRLFLGMFGCFVQQALPFVVSANIDRILLGSWFIFAAVLSSSYNAVLLSSLTVPIQEKGVQNIKELADAVSSGTFKVLATKGSTDKETLTESTDENLRLIGRSIIETEWQSSSKQVVAPADIAENTAIIGPKFFYLLEYGVAPHTNKRIFEESIETWNVAIAVRKDFCCKKAFMKYISRIMNCGIYHKFYRNELSRSQKSFNSSNYSKHRSGPLSFSDMLGAFLLLPAGYILALVSYFIEFQVYMRFRRRKKRKNRQLHYPWPEKYKY